ncbi:MAG: DNA/RNA non-specific endonuclease [Lachnospiraceae bacterium]|nr:DNA/RNA non-specific endonuclease [Lachnospiraceae bacterium]
MNRKKIRNLLLPFLAFAVLFTAGCASSDSDKTSEETVTVVSEPTIEAAIPGPDVSLADIPEYSGDPWVILNDNTPYFTEDEKTTDVFEEYSDLDDLGRCGTAYANICQELMPTEKRGDISEIHPTGWQSSRYDFIDGESLYNRCHLIAHELAGEDANEYNLITGTRYFNVDGMQSFEDMTADYVKETGNHVLYRVTPLFEGDNLVASGAVMEAYSVEDEGDGICFCIYCYNVQPGIEIDYANGDNWKTGDVDDLAVSINRGPAVSGESDTENSTASDEEADYILNTNTMKFHRPDCEGVADISEHNRQEYTGSRADLIEQGYSPCQTCNP